MVMQFRSAHPVLSAVLIGAVTLAPVVDAQASPLATKFRSIHAMQPEGGEGEAADDVAAEAPAEEAPAPAAEGPAPAPAAAAPAGPPPSKGLGMLISGAVIVGAYSLPLIGYGAYVVALGRAADKAVDGMGVVETGGNIVGGVLLTMGIIGLAVGGPLLGVGAYRFSKYQKWKSSQTVFLPSAGRTAFGTITPGLEIRF